MQLKHLSSVFAVCLLGTSACGTEATAPRLQPTAAVLQAMHTLRGDPGAPADTDCMPLIRQILDDAQAMQTTPEFHKLEKTKEFKAVMADEQALDDNNCSEVTSAKCDKLAAQSDKDQEAMSNTPEFQAVAQTSEYKTFVEHMDQAEAVGCLQ